MFLPPTGELTLKEHELTYDEGLYVLLGNCSKLSTYCRFQELVKTLPRVSHSVDPFCGCL